MYSLGSNVLLGRFSCIHNHVMDYDYRMTYPPSDMEDKSQIVKTLLSSVSIKLALYPCTLVIDEF